jgi:hypothetical protein
MEAKGINAVRHFYDDRINRTFVRVVVQQFEPQPSRLHSNRGIGLRIEVVRTPENFRGDLILLDWNSRVGKGVVGQIAKQFAERLGFAERLTMDNFLYLAQVAIFVGDLERSD